MNGSLSLARRRLN